MQKPSEGSSADPNELLVASREARWTFPTSFGRPVATDTPAWAQLLAKELSSLVAAAAWFLSHGDNPSATELAANTWRAWVLHHDEANGRQFLTDVLDAPGAGAPTRFRALVLYGDGLLALRLGAPAESRARNDAALEIARFAEDREAEGLAHLGLSRVDHAEGHGQEARTHAEQAYTVLCDLGLAYRQGPLHMRAQAANLSGHIDEAAALFEASVELNRKIGDHGMVVVDLHNLGHAHLRLGNLDRAERFFEECAALIGDTDDPYELALRAFNQASVAFARGAADRAGSLLHDARALLAGGGVALSPEDASAFDELERQMGGQTR
jgi:tetratricopeptide (TPR) repeat protein